MMKDGNIVKLYLKALIQKPKIYSNNMNLEQGGECEIMELL